MISFLWLWGLVRRRFARVLAVAGAVALVVAFVGTLGSYLVFVRAEVGRLAMRDVDVDWQIKLAPDANAPDVLRALRPQPGVVASELVGYGDAFAFEATTGSTVQTTGAGKVVGIGPGYRESFGPEFRDLIGSRNGNVLLQQTAANVHVAPGDAVTVRIANRPDVRVRIDGVVDMPNEDPFFQAVGAAGAVPQAPPDNVLVVPYARWRSWFDPARGDGYRELHVRTARHLPADPARAFSILAGERRNFEARLAGAAAVGDNLGARLDSARTDATYGTLLFLFLGLPGVGVGVALAAIAAATGAERRRAEHALLRVRGARPRTIVGVALTEALLQGVLGSVVGVAIAAAVDRLAWELPLGHVWGALLSGAAVGVLTTVTAVVTPAFRDLRDVARARRLSKPRRTPLARLGAVIAVAAAAVAVWYTTRTGYEVVVAPEGVPAVSVNYLSLVGPALAWIGGVALLATLAAGTIARGRRVIAAAARPIAGRLAAAVAAWIVRLRAPIVRAVILVCVAIAFAVSSSVFDASFAAQSRVDAELTNGADVAATAPPGVDLGRTVPRLRRLYGVRDAESMQHRFAYVGNDLQDLYGIHPRAIGRATTISDAYFGDGHARDRLADLVRTPNGAYVADETVSDYQLARGDMLRIRLLDALTHRYVAVPFRVLGVVREFPTAPTDSFVVANASYVASMTHSSAAETVLMRTSRSPVAVAADARRVLPGGATVRDIVTQRHITATGLVAVNVRGISTIELAFGALVTLWSIGLVLTVGFAERRRQFAIMSAVGARARHIRAFVVGESGTTIVLGTAGGAVLGGLIGWILVKVLRGVFDPPPQHPAVPWMYFGLLAGVLAVGAVVCTRTVLTIVRRTRTTALRELGI